jgi:proline iminopeptidase
MPRIRHRFGRTYYLRIKCRKKKKKTPIIFLHGGPGGTHLSLLKLRSLSRDRDLYYYDQIGGGESDPTPKRFWKIETFVKELSVLVNKWDLKEFILVGGSWGTTLALEYYLRTKDPRVQKIVFQSPLFSTKDWEMDANRLISKMPKKIQKIFKLCHEVGAMDAKVYRDASFEYYAKHVLRNRALLKKPKKKPNPHGNKIYEFMWGPTEFKALGTLKKYDRVKSLKKVKVPVLLICGQHDEATPQTSQRYQKLFPEAQLQIIKNASHSIARENPKAYLKALRKFL